MAAVQIGILNKFFGIFPKIVIWMNPYLPIFWSIALYYFFGKSFRHYEAANNSIRSQQQSKVNEIRKTFFFLKWGERPPYSIIDMHDRTQTRDKWLVTIFWQINMLRRRELNSFNSLGNVREKVTLFTSKTWRNLARIWSKQSNNLWLNLDIKDE